MERAGLAVEQRATYREHTDVDAWIRAAGPDVETAQTILALLTAGGTLRDCRSGMNRADSC
jgi:hypothetical protein